MIQGIPISNVAPRGTPFVTNGETAGPVTVSEEPFRLSESFTVAALFEDTVLPFFSRIVAVTALFLPLIVPPASSRSDGRLCPLPELPEECCDDLDTVRETGLRESMLARRSSTHQQISYTHPDARKLLLLWTCLPSLGGVTRLRSVSTASIIRR